MTTAVLLADRAGLALAPLSERTCLALLPVVGKSLVEHSIEALAKAAVRAVLIVVSPHADAVEQALGDGTRWGMHFDYLLTHGDEAMASILARARSRVAGDCLVVRGDVLRSVSIAEFVDHAAKQAAPCLAASVAGVLAGLWWLRESAQPLPALPSDPERGGWVVDGPTVDLAGKLSLVESLAAYHAANLDAAAGRFPELIIPGREVAVGVTIGRRSRVALSSVLDVPLFVGSRCEVKADAEILGNVVLADDVIVDQRATLQSAVVLPHSYIGELVEVRDAIVWANDLIDVHTGARTHVTDAFLLADLKTATFETALGRFTDRLVGAVLLLLSLPLWPLAALAGLISNPSAPVRWVQLRGNRRVIGDGGLPQREEFTALEAATSVPVLRDLPKLWAVVTGHLRLIGVRPEACEIGSHADEPWQGVRQEAPVGLFGPAQLIVPPDAPVEERELVEAYYARTRSAAGDFGWLARGAVALFSARAWRPAPRPHAV